MTAVFDHNQNPPKRLPAKGSAKVDGTLIAWGENTPDDQLAALGLYRQGDNDPIPAGHQLVSQERVIRDGKSALVRVTEPAPVVEPGPQEFPQGLIASRIETGEQIAGVVVMGDDGLKYGLTVVGGLPSAQQMQASPERPQAELLARVRRNAEKLRTSLDNVGKGNLQERIEVLEAVISAMRGDPLSEPPPAEEEPGAGSPGNPGGGRNSVNP